MADYRELCEQIIEKSGGRDNIKGAFHCMTRLRLTLDDNSKVDIDGIKAIPSQAREFADASPKITKQLKHQTVLRSGGLEENLDLFSGVHTAFRFSFSLFRQRFEIRLDFG